MTNLLARVPRAAKRLFAAMLVVPIAVFIVSAVEPGVLPESVGWMLLFASMPWSIPFLKVPIVGLVILVVGFALNATIVIVAAWRAVSWWLRTLKFRNDE